MKQRIVFWVVAAICITAAVMLVVLNLAGDRRQIRAPLIHEIAVGTPEFADTMFAKFGGAPQAGHSMETLLNGDEIFASMLSAIGEAVETINFETYIYWSGDIARQFAETLAAKARQGVEVRVLVDYVGSIPFDQDIIDIMTDAGVRFHRFRPVAWYTLDRVNNRTHRKLLVVDGTIGFTGGVGIGDSWRGDARTADEWRDNHYRVLGPVVGRMQAAFAENWLEATGEVLMGPMHFPTLDDAGDMRAQLVISSPHGGGQEMRDMLLTALASAREHIRIGMAYFVPDDVFLAQLVAARRRGVEVDIILPSENMAVPPVRSASRYFWGALLEAGVRIHEYQPTMYHAKLLVIDEVFTSIGSANFDERSFRLNDEANLNVFSAEFASSQIGIFEEDLRASRQISLQEWQSRPLRDKLTDWLASHLRPQL